MENVVLDNYFFTASLEGGYGGSDDPALVDLLDNLWVSWKTIGSLTPEVSASETDSGRYDILLGGTADDIAGTHGCLAMLDFTEDQILELFEAMKPVVQDIEDRRRRKGPTSLPS